VNVFQNNIWGGLPYIECLLDEKAYPLNSKLRGLNWIPNFPMSGGGSPYDVIYSGGLKENSYYTYSLFSVAKNGVYTFSLDTPGRYAYTSNQNLFLYLNRTFVYAGRSSGLDVPAFTSRLQAGQTYELQIYHTYGSSTPYTVKAAYGNHLTAINPALSYGMNGYYDEPLDEWHDYAGYPTSPKFVRAQATLKTPQELSGVLLVNAALGKTHEARRCNSITKTTAVNPSSTTYQYDDIYERYNVPLTLLISGKTDSRFQTQWETLAEFSIDYGVDKWYQWEEIVNPTKYKQIMVTVLAWRRDAEITRDVSLWKNCYIPPLVLFGR